MKHLHCGAPPLLGKVGFSGQLTFHLFLAVQLVIPSLSVNTARANGNPLNGASRRPFYVFAHNPNTLEDAQGALGQGANALEPDVQVGAAGNLVIAHDAYQAGKISLEDYLDGLHNLPFQYNLALVVFDVKTEAATAAKGFQLLQAIRDHLNTQGIGVYVIISVATRADHAVFDNIIGPNAQVQLNQWEGVQVDQEDDAGAIVKFFVVDRGYADNIGYGDGTIGPGPHLPTAMDFAVWSRAATGNPKAVTYVYTINVEDSMNLFIDSGVDGIITDDIPALAGLVRGRSDVFLATVHDNPFKPLKEAYGLKVTTADVGSAGTDAHLTFTLEGSLGKASVTVDSEPTGRMEHGSINYVTIPSKDLGALTSITVARDDSGNKPGWNLQEISVYSARWLKPDLCYHFTATLDDWIDANAPRTLPFRFHEYLSVGSTASSDGTLANPWKQASDGYCAVAPGGTVHIAPGLYRENLMLTKPCTLVFWGDHGAGPAVIGKP